MSIGEIYWTWVAYKDDVSQGKRRPCIILNEDHSSGDVLVLVIPTTSQAPKYPYPEWEAIKIPVTFWREAGLSKMSYATPDDVLLIKKSELTKADYIGRLNPNDLQIIQLEYVRYMNYIET